MSELMKFDETPEKSEEELKELEEKRVSPGC